jgi:glycosyltransferase involved in cell wall biosynthesis
MKILMLCGVFAKENEQEVIRHARAAVEFSANVFQQKLIAGFQSLEQDFSAISAPFVGAYPNASDMVRFKGFEDDQTLCSYVPFNNIWGLRNFSRARALKKAVQDFIRAEDDQKLILAYCTHTPFIEAAIYAKKKDPRIKVCLYVPDLPNYMNLSANRSWLYDVAKVYDVAVMTRLMKQVDSFVLLTEQMKDALPVGEKPYRVIEGIITRQQLQKSAVPRQSDGLIRVVYTGKLNACFGAKKLVDAFCMLPEPNYRLVLCGRGDCEEYIKEKAAADSRILYLGQVTADVAGEWIRRADVLVNPRPNEGEYTKYSFPSKNIEYLLSGNPVVGYMLSGMSEDYRRFMHIVADDRVGSLRDAIRDAACAPVTADAKDYLTRKCEAGSIARQILTMNGMEVR